MKIKALPGTRVLIAVSDGEDGMIAKENILVNREVLPDGTLSAYIPHRHKEEKLFIRMRNGSGDIMYKQVEFYAKDSNKTIHVTQEVDDFPPIRRNPYINKLRNFFHGKK